MNFHYMVDELIKGIPMRRSAWPEGKTVFRVDMIGHTSEGKVEVGQEIWMRDEKGVFFRHWYSNSDGERAEDWEPAPIIAGKEG
jgi:hypothetical protein